MRSCRRFAEISACTEGSALRCIRSFSLSIIYFDNSLIKMLYWMCEKTDMAPTGPQILHAIKRNFGGLKEENLDPVQEFIAKLPSGLNQPPDLQSIPPEVS